MKRAAGRLRPVTCCIARSSCPPVPLLAPLAAAPGARRHASETTLQRRYGQPLPETHPHLLREGELTPGIRAAEYAERRKRLMSGLPDGSAVVALGASLQYSAPGIFYPFRQQSDFYYLCGWLEPDSALLIEKTSSARGHKTTLFVPPNDAAWETWHGARTGLAGAINHFGADDAVDADLLPSRLRALLTDDRAAGPLYLDVPEPLAGPAAHGSQPRRSWLSRLSRRPSPPTALDSPRVIKQHDLDAVLTLLASPDSVARGLKPLRNAVEALRVVKSDAEVAVMRRAADLAGAAHASAMRFAEPGRAEADVAAHFAHRCGTDGGPAVRSAFVPVCASGQSALTLHYTANDCLLRRGDLVLFDAGCEWAGYASDVTRTFPVSGKFSEPQRDLYTAVLNCARAVADLCSARQERSLRGLHRESVELLRRELKQLGIDVDVGDLERRLYPHFVGHFLGLDLHDTPTCDRSRRLEAGMVLAIEPGLYIPHDDQFPRHFQGLCARIEDEVLVRDTDHVLLSANCPREVDDVEACCQGLLDP